ncbi:MAG TPA: GlsB/YeaQ/YmgE family stress response membrane protein [Aestuariivirgaceae bacterium]|nr:GlsB/YeaQ/YmgE family stress response membrane protein [Aestuariivirgaceae bacterium]
MEMPTLAQVIVWIVVGLIGGSLAGIMMTFERRGFGLGWNVVVGLAGALVGGVLFRLFGLFPALDNITISLRDVVAAFVGSLIIVDAYWIWQRSSQ